MEPSSTSQTQYICLPFCRSLWAEKEGREPAGHQLKSEAEGGYLPIVWEDTKRVIEVANASLSKSKPAWEEGAWREIWPPNLCLQCVHLNIADFHFSVVTKAWTASINVTGINSQLWDVAAKLSLLMQGSWVAQHNVKTVLVVTHCNDRTVLCLTKSVVIEMVLHHKGCRSRQLHDREDKGPDLQTDIVTAIFSSKCLQLQVALLPVEPPPITTGVPRHFQEGARLLNMGQDPLVLKRMAGSQHSHSLERDTFLYSEFNKDD